MTEPHGDCRWCGRPAWLRDDTGRPAHPCCQRWIGEHGHVACLGCEASARHDRERQRRRRAAPRTHRGRYVVDVPLPD